MTTGKIYFPIRFLTTYDISARNGNQTSIHLILLDVNDNAPQMPSKEDYEINENALEVNFIKH